MDIHNVSEYVTWNLPRPRYYIQDILPKQGVMLLYGEPKVKKSWLAEYMGFCIATGSPFLGFITEQARVLIAQFEISQISYYWRLKDMSANFDLQDGLLLEMSPGLMYLNDEEPFNRFLATIREYHPNVIILDCLAACFGGDENDGETMASFIEKLVRMKTECEASIVLIHHTNKNILTGSSVDRARGHSRLAGWVDTLVYMGKQPMGVQLQIKARQSSRELHNINIQFHNYMWTVQGQGGEPRVRYEEAEVFTEN
jgi:RecA-family ATPase